MKSCTFLGHRDCTVKIYEVLKEKIEELITQQDVRRFYVGTEGTFDTIVYDVLSELKYIYPYIEIYVVLSYLNTNKYIPNNANTLYPEGLERIHKRFAIIWRNSWMLQKSDYVICYVKCSCGGAWRFYEKAKRDNKKVFNIAETC